MKKACLPRREENVMRPAVRNVRLVISIAAILLLIAGTDAQTQPPAMDSPAFTAEGAFFAIVVTDLDASVPWYESNLGLHLVKRGKSPRVPAETVVLGGHNLFVELIHHDGKALPRVDNEASVPRLLKTGVIVAQKDFDQVAAYLQKRGVETGIFEDKEMVVRSFLFKDNDGNLIQFFTQNR
jgi:catechol 2,3-dioxygenase-like lactoylglutathione lyase family enzyme